MVSFALAVGVSDIWTSITDFFALLTPFLLPISIVLILVALFIKSKGMILLGIILLIISFVGFPHFF
jgi:hypothetical protein